MDILLEQLTLAVGKVLGYVRELGVLELCYLGLYLLVPALGLHALDELVDVLLGAAIEPLVGFLLIELGSLHAKVTRARVYNDVYRAVLALVSLDEVVASAESTDAPLRTNGVDVVGAVKLREVYPLTVAVSLVAYLESRGYLLIDELVELLQLNMCFLQLYGLHTAADVHSDEIGDYLIGDVHCRTDSAACSCVDIGHYTYLRALAHWLVAELGYLRNGSLVYDLGKYLC